MKVRLLRSADVHGAMPVRDAVIEPEELDDEDLFDPRDPTGQRWEDERFFYEGPLKNEGEAGCFAEEEQWNVFLPT